VIILGSIYIARFDAGGFAETSIEGIVFIMIFKTVTDSREPYSRGFIRGQGKLIGSIKRFFNRVPLLRRGDLTAGGAETFKLCVS